MARAAARGSSVIGCACSHRFAKPPGALFEIGPGHGTLGELAVAGGWHYTAIEASPLLIDVLRRRA